MPICFAIFPYSGDETQNIVFQIRTLDLTTICLILSASYFLKQTLLQSIRKVLFEIQVLVVVYLADMIQNLICLELFGKEPHINEQFQI